jgi:hypothetical protein
LTIDLRSMFAPAFGLRSQDRCLKPLGHLSIVCRFVTLFGGLTIDLRSMFAPAFGLRSQDRCLKPLGHLSVVYRDAVLSFPAFPRKAGPSLCPG